MAESDKLLLYNKVMDRTAIKQFISRLIIHFGMVYTAHIPDQPKTLGFQQATYKAVSLGIDDPSTTPSKGWFIRDAERQGSYEEEHHRYGNVHAVERLRQLIDTRYTTSEYMKQEMTPNFKITDPSNPVHMMSFPGARGNISQIHQLLGMRGSMSDPKGQIIDLPIQSNSREGPSLTEYIISCYGARKGVVDIAIRTADAGYLTRRLVEVVQHIVVRRIDCGTIEGILISPIRDEQRNIRMIAESRLIGRVLADNVYVDARCIATRDQDIGAELANQLMFQTQPISIRSPLTCKSMFWICKLCYGWSLTHGNPVESGEAVGIIAGQSIGEPGTQLTLRTFHTGGIFTGGIAQHIRTPFTGIIKSNTDSVYPTRTRHGHPAWICDNDLSITIGNKYEVRNSTIPPQSLILVQNNQHVESKQVIAEVHVTTSTSKERIKKSIYSSLDGEMHWGAKVRHNPEHVHSNIHFITKTSYVRVLSGRFHSIGGIRFFYRDEDQIDVQFPLTEENKPLLDSHSKKDQINPESFNFFSRRNKKTFNHSEFDHSISNNRDWNSIYSIFILHGYKVTQKHKKGRVFFLPERDRNRYNEQIPDFEFVPKISKNGVLQNDDILAISNDPRYITKDWGIIKYGTIKIDSIGKKNEIIGNRKTKIFMTRHEIIGGGNFFSIPEEVHIVHEPFSPILVEDNSIIQAGAKITSDIHSRVSGSVRIRRITDNKFEIRILPGCILHPGKAREISEQRDALIQPGKRIFGKFRSRNWAYLQWIIPRTDKTFALLRPAMEYEIPDKLATTFSHRELLGEQGTLRVKAVQYLLYEDGKEVRINDTGIQLVQTCLVLDREKGSSMRVERAYTSFIEIGTNKTFQFQYFLQLSLIKYSLDTGNNDNDNNNNNDNDDNNNTADSIYILGNKVHYTSHSSNRGSQSFSKHKGIIRILPDRDQENTSFLILSSDDSLSLTLSFTGPKYYDTVEKNDIKFDSDVNASPTEFLKDSLIFPSESNKSTQFDLKGITADFISSIQEDLQENLTQVTPLEKLGILGNLHSIANPLSSLCWLTHGRVPSNKYSIIENLKNTSEVPKWYFSDENRRNSHLIFCKNIIFYLLNWCFSLFCPYKKTFRLVSLGQLICEGVSTSEYGPLFRSCQIIAIHIEFVVIRLAKPYLANVGATVHNSCGDIVKEGDALITLIYERLRFENIIFQGLPKIEQLLESRPNTSVSMDFKDSFEDWNNDVTWIFGYPWSFFLSARVSLEQSRIDLVDQIQKGYRSQGVKISDKHLEIIVRQMTSKIVTLEDGIANVFLPGELIEVSRAQRMNRALEEEIPYKPILLGITKASINTKSFLSEVSFQETTRILARAAIRGKIDWLKGLKENVILGGIVPAGTGCREAIWQVTLEKKGGIYLGTKNNKLFINEIKHILFYGEKEFPISSSKKTIHEVLRTLVSEADFDK
uniref:DNA-directed RNA polymerase subunit beta'' n=1 Tax=Isoetes butleri TaxID=264931 RepID=A0A2U8KHG1_9TRAC|nr:RNA polymerase beta' subunit [Isoetes butleri]AWK91490.1 RNA polymerase beta' subunit [Isoetes butleri]AYM33962.1 RNA polymerase beta' subunit [Isoetes butleri]